jgi:sugar lactone lactonase YvrE
MLRTRWLFLCPTATMVAAACAGGALAVSGGDSITTIAGRGDQNGSGPYAHGGFSGDGGPASQADLGHPSGLVVDPSGNVYICDYDHARVRKVSPNGTITTMAGNGRQGFSGDGGPATSAQLDRPTGLALDAQGNLYIGDAGNARVRKVTPAGTISTFAGAGRNRNGTSGFSGDGGPATAALMSGPVAIAIDRQGNLYISDDGNNVVRKVDARGIITTVVGTPGARGFSGDGGPAVQARVNLVHGLAVDVQGNLYLADYGNNRIRKLTRDGKIRTIAGTGGSRSSGDGGPATRATFSIIRDVAVDARGNVYLTDSASHSIRKITPNGKIATVAGGNMGPIARGAYSGDRGLARRASLATPTSLAVDSQGSLYIGEHGNYRVRKITNVPPIAAFTAIPTTGPAPLSVSFDASRSLDRGGAVWSYRWEFGDGTSGTGKKIRHTFARAGSYTVKLTVIDDSGGSGTRTHTVTVSA